MTQDKDVNEVSEMWRDLKIERQKKRASNRESSARLLQEAGIGYKSNNGGEHLMITVAGGDVVADFWPGTGRYIFRDGGIKAFGVRNLIKEFNRLKGST